MWKIMDNDIILIVDDDGDIRNMLGIYLGNEGFQFIKCDNAKSAMEVLDKSRISLILLDVMMPGIDGIKACIDIRKDKKMPIIFMSAKTQDIDIIQGLAAGADDYVTKPFNPLLLMSRIKAQLRRYHRYNEKETEPLLQYEDLILNTSSRQVWINGQEIIFTPKEYCILELLLHNRGNILSIAQIYEKVWHEEFFHSENTVMMHIANIRNKLRENSCAEIIKTVWGRGYKI